jgi:hypothetical protein
MNYPKLIKIVVILPLVFMISCSWIVGVERQVNHPHYPEPVKDCTRGPAVADLALASGLFLLGTMFLVSSEPNYYTLKQETLDVGGVALLGSGLVFTASGITGFIQSARCKDRITE